MSSWDVISIAALHQEYPSARLHRPLWGTRRPEQRWNNGSLPHFILVQEAAGDVVILVGVSCFRVYYTPMSVEAFRFLCQSESRTVVRSRIRCRLGLLDPYNVQPFFMRHAADALTRSLDHVFVCRVGPTSRSFA
jgi:hypothetical protein